MPRRAIHPDRRCLGSRARNDALPHAARRPAITPARRHLALSFFEAIIREGIQNLLRRGEPSVLLFDPCHPTLLAKLSEAIHPSYLVPPIPLCWIALSLQGLGPTGRLNVRTPRTSRVRFDSRPSGYHHNRTLHAFLLWEEAVMGADMSAPIQRKGF